MRLVRDRRGVTGIDFAVAISVVLVLVFAIIDLGSLFAAQHALDYGVVQAARYAVVNSTSATTSSITDVLRDAITPAIGAGNAATAVVSVAYPAGAAVGKTVQISASYAWSPSTNFDFIPRFTLTSSQTLTIQH
jgi:Flp pilus assembly protein TadG